MVEAWFDGCCEPVNPGGYAAWGALVKVDGSVVYADGGYCGTGRKMSNNVAEYAGAEAALLEAEKHSGKVILRGDSKLVIMQLSKRWGVRGGLYVPFYEKAVLVASRLKPRLRMEWIPRRFNGECDKLSKGVLKEMNIKFRIQPEEDDIPEEVNELDVQYQQALFKD